MWTCAIVALATARVEARAARDLSESDRLRDEIATAGWEVRDVAGGYELVPLDFVLNQHKATP